MVDICDEVLDIQHVEPPVIWLEEVFSVEKNSIGIYGVTCDKPRRSFERHLISFGRGQTVNHSAVGHVRINDSSDSIRERIVLLLEKLENMRCGKDLFGRCETSEAVAKCNEVEGGKPTDQHWECAPTQSNQQSQQDGKGPQK